MNVLFVAPLPEPVTGQSLACQVLFEHLAAHDEVQVVNLSKQEFRQGVSSLGRIFQVAGTMLKVWRRKKTADVIYFTVSESFAGNLKDLIIYALCYRSLSRMTIHLHGGAGLREIMRARGSLRRWLNSFFLRRVGAVIVLGQRHVGVFAQTVPGPRIHIVPNFAQDYLFADPDAVRRKFAQLQPLRILFLSNLLPGKGHVELLNGYLGMDPATQSAVEIDFAGGFESQSQELEFRRRIAGQGGLRYHGIVGGQKKKELFAAAHVFCLPTYYPYEGQPISILEAYASGCAVITTDHSGIFDIFTDGENGSAVPARSAEALREVLTAIVAAPGRLEHIALNNLATAQRSYRTSTHTHRVREVLRGVAAQAGAGQHAAPTSAT